MFEPIAAPVFSADPACTAAEYSSVVVVRAEAAGLQRFADLQGHVFCVNNLDSWSGRWVGRGYVLYYLCDYSLFIMRVNDTPAVIIIISSTHSPAIFPCAKYPPPDSAG